MRGNAKPSYATFAFLARFYALSRKIARKKRAHDYRYMTDYDDGSVDIRDFVCIFKIRWTWSLIFERIRCVNVKRRWFFSRSFSMKVTVLKLHTQNFPFASYCKDDGYDANGKVEEDGAAFFLKGKVIRSRYDALASSGLICNFPRCSSIRYNFSCLRALCGPFPISCCSSPQAEYNPGKI